jgi:opacity protein-like surface antigen
MRQLGMLVAAALLFSAVSANAQIKQGQQEAGINIGAAIPMSDTTLGANVPSTTNGTTGLGIGANYDYMIMKNISVGGDFQYRDFGNKSLSGGTLENVDNWTLMVTGKYQFMPDNQIRPYGLLGLGFGGESEKGVPTGGGGGISGNGTGFAYAIGVGAEYDINAMWAAGVELRWSGLSASESGGIGSQGSNSLDILVSGHYKFGA